jgi:hypothetical protein
MTKLMKNQRSPNKSQRVERNDLSCYYYKK